MTDPTPARPARPRLDDPDAVDQIVASAIAEVESRAPAARAPRARDTPAQAPPAQATPASARRSPRTPARDRSGPAPARPVPASLRSETPPAPAEVTSVSTGPSGPAVALLDPPDERMETALDIGSDRSCDTDGGRAPSPARSALEWFVVIAGAVLVALAIKTFLFQAFYIPSGSMLPTLQIDDRVLVNKVSYDLHDVNRGDLVVFERPGLADAPADTGEADDLIKRVIGLPGDSVEVRDSVVYVNGAALDEPYLPDGLQFGNAPPVVVPDDHVFVMGDNRPDSRDSRAFGPVPVEDIVGRAFLRIWPPASVGFL